MSYKNIALRLNEIERRLYDDAIFLVEFADGSQRRLTAMEFYLYAVNREINPKAACPYTDYKLIRGREHDITIFMWEVFEQHKGV